MLNPIKTVSLENFGRYQGARFDFAPGLNIIRGPNRSGKTWILRGISAALCNTGRFNADDPAKDEVRFFNGTELAPHYSVELEFGDGLQVRRYRDRTLNMYRVGGTEYDKVGRGFFEPVGDATGIFPTVLDGKPENAEVINIKLLSDDRFFLLGRNDLDRNRILTRLVGMDVVEEAERATVKDLSQATRELSEARSGVEAQQAIVDKYKPVPSLVKDMDNATGQIEEADTLRVTADKATEVGDAKLKAVRAIGYYSNHQHALATAVNALQQNLDDATAQYDKADTLEHLLTVAHDAEQTVATTKAHCTVLQTATDLLGLALLSADEVLERVQEAEDIAENQHSLTKAIATTQADIDTLKRDIAASGKKYNQLLHEYGVCPVCGQDIDAKHKCGGQP